MALLEQSSGINIVIMQTFSQFILTERVLSIGLNPNHEKYRNHHRQELHDMLRHSYKTIGGYGGHASGSEDESKAIHNDINNSAIKAIRRNGRITAAKFYKLQHGRKGIGLGTDSSDQGKTDVKKIMKDDHAQKRSWAELSGAPEHLSRKMGVPVVPNNMAHKLIGKPDIEAEPDGEHYSRKIGQHRHTKVIMGHPKLAG